MHHVYYTNNASVRKALKTWKAQSITHALLIPLSWICTNTSLTQQLQEVQNILSDLDLKSLVVSPLQECALLNQFLVESLFQKQAELDAAKKQRS